VLIGTATDDGSNLLQVDGSAKLAGDLSGVTDLYVDDQIISTGDTNTYLQFHAADQFRVVTGGTERFEVTNVSPHILITGNLKVQGNIEATGTLDTTGQNDLSVSDKKITLNDGEVGPGVGGVSATGEAAVSGIFIDRGVGQDSASFVYNDATGANRWEARSSNGVLGPLSASVLTGNLDWSYIQSKPDPVVTVTLTGDVTGTGNTTLTDLASGTISFATTIQANSVALGTDTTGNYVATIAAGTSGAETSSSGLTISAAAGEGTAATIAHADTSAQASVNNSGNTFIQDITLDTFGHITGITSATTSIGNATITLAAGTDLSTGGDFTTNQSGNETITFNHSAIGHSVTSGGALTPAYGASFTILDSVQVSTQGHVTDYRTRSVTIPASDNTNTTYDLSIIQTGGNDDNPAIRLAAGGSGSGNDDLTLTGGGAITITRTSATGLTIEHTDTSTYNSTPSITTGSATGTVITGFDVDVDAYGHVTAVTGTNYNLDNRYIRSFQVEDGDGTEVTINQANEWKFVEGVGTGASIDINWTDTDNGTDADPYDLTFTVTNTDRGSSQNIFKILNVTDTDTGYTWTNTGTITANLNDDSATFVSGTEINFDVDATKGAIRANHVNVTRTDTTSTASPGYSGTFTVIDTLTTNARGHVTAANVKTVTIPASDNTNTTYSLSTEPGDDGVSEKIRLTAGGSGSGTDDIVLAVQQTGTTDGLDISETGDTITFAHHDTSTLSGAQGSAGIASITVDEMGHVTAVTTATYNNYSHPTQSAIDVNATDNGVNVIDRIQVNTLGHVTSVTTRNLSAATSTTGGVVNSGSQEFGGVKTFKGGQIIIDRITEPELTFNYVPADTEIAANESLGKIEFKGNDGATNAVGVRIQASAYDAWNASDAPGELSVWVVRDGSTTLYETLTINQNKVVVNEDGQDVDFEIQTQTAGTGSGTALFVNSNSGYVGIGTNSTAAPLTLGAKAGIKPYMEFRNSTTSTDWDVGDLFGGIVFLTENVYTSYIESIQTLENQNIPYGGLSFRTGGNTTTPAERMLIDHNGSVVMIHNHPNGATPTWADLPNPVISDERLSLSLVQSVRRGNETNAAIRGAATLSGTGSYLVNGVDSDVFTIIGAGNNTNPYNAALGTMSIYVDKENGGGGGIRFSTNGGALTERMRIANTGYVGIGTTGPLTLFHVQSTDDLFATVKSTKSDGQAAISFVNDARQYNVGVNNLDKFDIYDLTASASRLSIDTNGNVTIKSGLTEGGGVLNLENTATAVNGQDWGSINFISNDASTNASGIRASIVATSTSFNGDGNLDFYTAPLNGPLYGPWMRIHHSGYIGVGGGGANGWSAAYTPQTTMHLKSTAPVLRFTDTNSFTDSSDGVQIRAGGSGNMQFEFYDNSASTTTEHMTIVGSSGNVGIGTVTPVERLHVHDPAQVIGGKQLVLEGGEAGYGAGISFQTVIGSSGGIRNEMARITADGNNSFNTTASTQDAELRFYTTNDGAIGQRMVLDNLGYVGIGTTDPQRFVHIHADPAVTGSSAMLILDQPASDFNGGGIISFRGNTTGTGAANFVEYGAVGVKRTNSNNSNATGHFRVYNKVISPTQTSSSFMPTYGNMMIDSEGAHHTAYLYNGGTPYSNVGSHVQKWMGTVTDSQKGYVLLCRYDNGSGGTVEATGCSGDIYVIRGGSTSFNILDKIHVNIRRSYASLSVRDYYSTGSTYAGTQMVTCTYKGTVYLAHELPSNSSRTLFFNGRSTNNNDPNIGTFPKLVQAVEVSSVTNRRTVGIINFGEGGPAATTSMFVDGMNLRFGTYGYGIQFNSASGSSETNVLNDYEEGTWTPTYTAETTAPSVSGYTATYGSYTKIGDMVTCWCRIATTGIASQGSGNLQIAGLPFSVQAVGNSHGVGSIGYANSWGNVAPQVIYISPGGNKANLVRNGTSTSYSDLDTGIDAGSMNTGGQGNDVICTLIYKTDQ
jgi:hypothetical protein